MERFDRVIVGAGSAGAVLAARLSEDPDTSVLLLEAGPDHTSADTPSGIASVNFFDALAVPDRLWRGLVAVRAAGQSASLYRRGRGAGGSSAVNGMCALRGTPEDYDRWVAELGCPGWGWPEMLAAFLAVEDDTDYGGDAHHGRGGPVPLTRFPLAEAPPIDRALRDAALGLGYPDCDDYHASGATGVSRAAFNVRGGRRVSTNDAYLEAARRRPNLSVRGGVVVDRIALDGRRAVGLVLAGGGGIEAGEVVVSAGAIHSPALLLRSGIGPELGLPVGANLIDHPSANFYLRLNEQGRATSIDCSVSHSMLRYSSGLADAGANDMQMLCMAPVGASEDACTGAVVFCAAMRVFSRGEIRLRSIDPEDDPIVEFRMLSDDRDLVRLRDGVRRLLELFHHPTVTPLVDGVFAGRDPIDSLSDDQAIDAWLAANVADYVHAAGTCRMGTPGDPAAVVDTECRVIGFDGLRVCDASVMPDLPRANTHLTTVAIAERAATLMRRT